ncbi:DUF6236 family protein [Amycolatopsis sp. NPDC098790]|uniref:DUF6236 family protein n=1 Tax=Amycolatopsis sp. NPDC098790 TaxID=3363939 RepID=UPI0038049B74
MYYPYIHIRDDSWLKAAALYWPRLARLTPDGFPRYDSEVAKTLAGELDFFLNIEPPASQVEDVAAEFLKFVTDNHHALQQRYDPATEHGGVPRWHDAVDEMRAAYLHPFHGSVHAGKMTAELHRELVDYGLGKVADDGTWVTTHPAISAAYATTLVDRIANANQLAVITDQPKLHALHGDDEGYFSSLLGDTAKADGEQPHAASDVAALYAHLAVKTVIPRNIEDIPVQEIVKVRKTLASEFDAFRDHLGTLAGEFSNLAQVENPTVLQARLQMLVDRNLRRPTEALERSLRRLGFDPAGAILDLKSSELPALAAAVTSAAGVPKVVAEAGLAAARLVAGGARARATQRDARQNSPVGYLLGLKQQFGRRSVRERVRHPFS